MGLIGRFAAGAAIGGLGMAAYNGLEHKGSQGVGNAAIMGGLAWTGLGLGKMAMKSGLFKNAGEIFGKGRAVVSSAIKGIPGIPAGVKSGYSNFMKGASMGAGSFAGNLGFRGVTSNQNWLRSAINGVGGPAGIAKFVSNATPGAIIGAGAGAGYGAFSDKDSMISGAMKGALLGAAGYGIYKTANLQKVIGRIRTPKSTAITKPFGGFTTSKGYMNL